MNSGLAIDRKAAIRRRHRAVRPLLFAMVLLLAIALTALTVRYAWIRHVERGDDRRLKLEEICLAFEMYANESKGEKYPPMASVNAAFRVDLEALAPYLGPDDQDLRDYLVGKTGIDVCYLGHLVVSDSAAQALLDEYEDKGIEQLRDPDIQLDHASFHGRAWYPTQSVYRLREGVERMIYDAFCDASATDKARALIPVLWELPDEADPCTRHGGWVLYMNGKAEWKPYPGEFPMSEEFVRRLRDMMRTPPAKWKDARKRFVKEYPEAVRICEALRPLRETRFLFGNRVLLSWAVAHFDQQPTVEVEGHWGYRVVLRNESLKWNDMTPTRFEPGAIIELVVFPPGDDFSPGSEQRIPWNWQLEDDQACAVDLGQGARYRWFGRAAPPWLGFIQERLALTGGKGYLDELVVWLTRNKDFEARRLALGALSRYGAAAISLLEEEVGHPSIIPGEERIRVEELVRTLELIPDGRAVKLLVALYHSEDEQVRGKAGWALMERPRPEGKEVYLDLLRRGKYTDGVYPIQFFKELARAAAQFGGSEARPLLQEMCAHPNKFVASQARLALEGWPVPEGLIGVLGEPGEAGPARGTTAQDSAPAFAPHRQGDLHAGACLDIDTGRVFEVPISVAIAEDPAVTRAWLRKNGIDVTVEYIHERKTLSLLLLDFGFLSDDGQDGERSASDVVGLLQHAQGPPLGSQEEVEPPIARLFQTFEGASGVLHGQLYEEDTGSKGGPERSIRLSYRLVQGVPIRRLVGEAGEVADTLNQMPKTLTDKQQIGAARRAILEYARTHEKGWPDSLEDVAADGYLKMPDPDTFLRQFEYVKPWITLEELEGLGIFARTRELSDYQTVLVVRRKQNTAANKVEEDS